MFEARIVAGDTLSVVYFLRRRTAVAPSARIEF
jgi:hypothetical protein